MAARSRNVGYYQLPFGWLALGSPSRIEEGFYVFPFDWSALGSPGGIEDPLL